MNSVAESSNPPRAGRRTSYASISSWILPSSTMRSVRTISWIWKSTVSRFSKSRVRLSPSAIRRAFFSSITRARIWSRTFS